MQAAGLASFQAALFIVALVVVVRFALPYLLPFAAALVLAVLIDPVVGWIERRSSISRGAAAAGVLLCFLSACLLVAGMLAVNVSAELALFYERLPSLAVSWREGLEGWIGRLHRFSAGLPQPLDAAAQQQFDALLQSLSSSLAGLLESVKRLPSFLWMLVVSGLATFFLSRDQRQLRASLVDNLPVEWRVRAGRFVAEVAAGIFGFLRAQCILVCVSAALSVAGLLLFRVRYAWLLGLLAGLLDLVPMVGPSGVFVPLVAALALEGELARSGGLVAVWLVLLLVRQGIEPRILGAQLGLHPLTSLVAMYVGIRLWGASGLWVGPLTVIGGKAFWVVMRQGSPPGNPKR